MEENLRQLLLKDLCARLPYGVKINIYDDYSGMMKDDELNVFHLDSTYNIEYKKLRPYLRPMSSMTEEEKYTYRHMLGATLNSEGESIMFVYVEDFSAVIDWLNTNHFDFRGLIPMGLALEAPADMYKVE